MTALRNLGSAVAIAAFVAVVVVIASFARSAPEPIQPGAVGSPEPPPVVESSPVPSLDLGLACGQFTVDALRYGYTAEEWAALADVVVVGRIEAISEGQWATEDGKEPRLDQGERPTAMNVFRIASIAIADVGKASLSGDVREGRTIDVRVLGGTVGCRTFTISGQPEVKVGAEFALFLAAQPEPNLAASTFTGFDVIDMWPIMDGLAHGPAADITVADLLAAAARSD